MRQRCDVSVGLRAWRVLFSHPFATRRAPRLNSSNTAVCKFTTVGPRILLSRPRKSTVAWFCLTPSRTTETAPNFSWPRRYACPTTTSSTCTCMPMRASSRWRVAQLALNCRQSPQAAMNQRSRPVVAYGLPLDQLENLLSEGQALAEDRQRALTTLTRKYCMRTPTLYCTCIPRTSVAVRFSSRPTRA